MKMLRLLSLTLFVILSSGVSAQMAMPRIELTVGMYRIEAEVAANQPHRMQGLMHRQHMEAQQGMLFVFTEPNRHCMWMRNTLIPLSVAFLDELGTVLNIEDMEPQTEVSHCAAKAARYALEMNKGWFAQKGIKAGARLNGLARAPKPM